MSPRRWNLDFQPFLDIRIVSDVSCNMCILAETHHTLEIVSRYVAMVISLLDAFILRCLQPWQPDLDLLCGRFGMNP